MGRAFVALKRGRGQGGDAGASPKRAVTKEPTPPTASFQCNPEGWKRLGRFSALLARARPLRVLPLRSRLEKRPNRFQQMPFPFNQWFLRRHDGMSPLIQLLAPATDKNAQDSVDVMIRLQHFKKNCGRFVGLEGLPEISRGRKPPVQRRFRTRPGRGGRDYSPHGGARHRLYLYRPCRGGMRFTRSRGLTPPANFGLALRANTRKWLQF